MKRVLLTLFVILSATKSLEASPFDLEITPQAGQPLVLMPNETALVDITITGVEAGESLDSLGATVTASGGIRFIAANIGEVVPNPTADPLDAIFSVDDTTTDVAFLTLSSDPTFHITANGIFATVEVEAIQAGTASLQFTFADATLFNSTDPNQPTPAPLTSGAALSIDILVVPEPTSLLLAAVALGLFSSRRRIQTPA